MNNVKNAVLKYSKKHMPKQKRLNKKPEKVTEKQILCLAPLLHLDLTVVESKATYNPAAGRYMRSPTSESVSDLVGNTHEGVSVWIELKALGKKSAINSTKQYHQRVFLERKIRAGCFACVTDSAEDLRHTFYGWTRARRHSNKAAVEYLLGALPKARTKPIKEDDGPLFD